MDHAPLDPKEVHDLGNERWDAIDRRNGTSVAARLGYHDPASAIEDRKASGNDTPGLAEALVELVEDQVAAELGHRAPVVRPAPKANCRVKEIEAYRAADMAAAFYMPPTADGRPGTYYINTHDLAGKALHQIACVTTTRRTPGITSRSRSRWSSTTGPRLRRFGGSRGLLRRGWGLYSERLADEMGLYVDDWERLGMLVGQVHRAARPRSPTRASMPSDGRAREVIEKLVAGAHPEARSRKSEVDRTSRSPAQALGNGVHGGTTRSRTRAWTEEKERVPRPGPQGLPTTGSSLWATAAPGRSGEGVIRRAGPTQAGLRAPGAADSPGAPCSHRTSA